MTAIIETENLTKIYEGAFRSQDVRALDHLSLSVEEGEIFAYLGPNGSGKTTTIKLLLGLIFPTEGELRIMGRSDVGARAVQREIGYLPEGAYYPEFLRGEEVLRFYGRLYGMGGKQLETRIAEVLEQVGMTRARRRLIRGYSKGMRQRIGLAQALISNPKVLILDEPTTGLDPIARKEIRDILVNLRNEGKTLLICSHELLEVEMISDRVGILNEGRLLAHGGLGMLLTERDTTIVVEKAGPEAVRKFEAAGIGVEDVVDSNMELTVPATSSVYEALEICKAENVGLVSVRPRRETLEELFVRVVGEKQEEKAAVQ